VLQANRGKIQSGGRRLINEELEKIEQMLEWLRTHPNIDNSED
jgi:hypothetical protein